MTYKHINLRKIILASASPRRKLLLEECGFALDIKPMDVDETADGETPLNLVAEIIAIKKAEAALPLIQSDEIVLAADSVVVLGDKLFGKPHNRDDAFRMLASLSGKVHTVFTGVCLLDAVKRISFTSQTEVFMRPLSAEEIDWYIDHFKPYDKAGSYAIQEWIGLCKVPRIEGSHANIMGLPTDLVYEGLKQFKGALVFSQ